MNYNGGMKQWMVLLFLMAPATLWAAQEPQEKPAPKRQAPATPPSLADLAKASRQHRQSTDKPVRTITNADLSKLKANVTTSTAPAAVAPSSDEETVGETDAAASEGASEELSPEELQRWKEAFAEARTDLRNAVSEGIVLQLRMNNLRNAFLRQSDGTTQERIQGQLQATLDLIESNKKAQSDARAAISRLQGEARDAGLSQALIRELTGTLPEPPPEILSESTGDGSR